MSKKFFVPLQQRLDENGIKASRVHEGCGYFNIDGSKLNAVPIDNEQLSIVGNNNIL